MTKEIKILPIKAAIVNVRAALKAATVQSLIKQFGAMIALHKAISELITVAAKAGKIIEELEHNNVHLPDPTCLRCGVVLDTAEGFQTGICANCWEPETDEEVEFVDGEWKPKLPLTT